MIDAARFDCLVAQRKLENSDRGRTPNAADWPNVSYSLNPNDTIVDERD